MMKHVLAVLAMFPMAAFAASSVPVGTFELGGSTNLGFHSASEEIEGLDGIDQTVWTLGGTGLYYVSPNLSVGGRLNYASVTTDFGGDKIGTSTFFLGPAVSLAEEVSPQVELFGVAAIGYARRNQSETGFDDVTGSGPGFALEAGLKYFVIKNVSFNASVGYDWANYSVDVPGGSFDVTDSGFGLNVGVSIYLPTK
jgi:hypothetical protein